MGIFSKISSLFKQKKLDSNILESLSDALILGDIAPDITADIISKLRKQFRPDDNTTEEQIKSALRDILQPFAQKLCKKEKSGTPERPNVILVIGVNGAGKTTTIGKMAAKMSENGQKVVVGACDTFRAAAGEQLSVWAARANATLIPENQDNCSTDPAATAFQAIDYAIKNNSDVVILDTAGRLHNRTDLMDELAKMTRVIKKLIPDAPHETYLVLDATSGQNVINQITDFDNVAPLTGLIVTKMDSTSKGGFLITYAAKNQNPLPIFTIGYGEKITDMRDFSPDDYLNRLLDI